MTQAPAITVQRWLLDEHGYVLMEAPFQPLFQSHLEALRRDDLRQPDPEALEFTRRILQGLVLWASFLPEDTSTAWSLLLPSREWRIFACADGSASRCVVRWSPCEAEHRQVPPLFDSQTQRVGMPVQRSMFEPATDDARGLVREFLERSQQGRGGIRVSEDATGSAQMLLAVHDHKDASWAGLRRFEGLLTPEQTGTRTAFPPERRWIYDCGCDPDRLRAAILAAADGDVEAVFGGEERVLVECPRCGRTHPLTMLP